VGTKYWATSTQTNSNPEGIFPLFHSRDLVGWQRLGSVLAIGPAWTRGDYWAPEISKFKDKYFVYYSALCSATSETCSAVQHSNNPRCIGVAVSRHAIGPYIDKGSPILCQSLGAIDPMPFAIGNEQYLIWNEDANSCQTCNIPSRMWAQQLSSDGLSLVGERHSCLGATLDLGRTR
jgi:xylan 1,4-beta-xylosidase